MPVILAQKSYDVWLNPETPEEQLLSLLSAFPEELTSSYPISSRINSIKNDDPESLMMVGEKSS